ncbi:MAG: acyl-CoA dehydrogenase protein [Ramlibacter sp.]|jgi:alkylation response protein AidB-like acyl-CoA dehydrogenase|nr:acyl-CoA dehydrogenase protein [Ramlibacter sp.]
MQATLTTEAAEQTQMLRESAADFVRGSTDMKKLRERRGTLPGYEPGLLRQMAELGWLGILVAEDHGGLGLGFAEMAVVLEELGKGLLGEPLASTVLAARLLQHGANEDLKARLLPGLVDASALPCVAWQEGVGGLDVDNIQTTARQDGESVVLDGAKRFVAGAAGAAGFIVSARGAQGLGLYWVDAKAEGVALRHEWRADETPSGVLELKGVRVQPQDALCPQGAQAAAALERAVDEAAVMASAEMLGVMEAALQMALGYMRTRVQFGKPIGSFQALQHKAADLYVQQELARAVLDDAVRELDAGSSREEQAKLASRCKSRASDAGLRVTREVIQLHGAIGYTDEYDAGLYLKRALVLSGWLGNSSAHRRRFARLTGGVVTV